MSIFYVYSDAETIYECIEFLTKIQFILCCNGLYKIGDKYKSTKWTVAYTRLLASMLTFGMGFAIYSKLANPYQANMIWKLDHLVLTIGFMEVIISLCMFIAIVISMNSNIKQHIRLIDHINELDKCFMTEFGATMNYSKLKRKNIMIMSVITVFYVGSVVIVFSQIAQGDLALTVLGAFCYSIVTGGPHFSSYTHMNLAEVIKIRFRLLQKLIDADYLNRAFPERDLRNKRIFSGIEMYKSLHKVIEEVNQVYGTSLIVTLFHDFTLTTSEIYLMIGGSLEGKSTDFKVLACVFVCMFPPLYKMIISPIYMQMAMNEAKKCLRAIQLIDSSYPGSEFVRQMVTTALLWNFHNKVEFQSGQLVVINKKILIAVTSAILNYLLILLQFRMTEDFSTKEKKNFLGLS